MQYRAQAAGMKRGDRSDDSKIAIRPFPQAPFLEYIGCGEAIPISQYILTFYYLKSLNSCYMA